MYVWTILVIIISLIVFTEQISAARATKIAISCSLSARCYPGVHYQRLETLIELVEVSLLKIESHIIKISLKDAIERNRLTILLFLAGISTTIVRCTVALMLGILLHLHHLLLILLELLLVLLCN